MADIDFWKSELRHETDLLVAETNALTEVSLKVPLKNSSFIYKSFRGCFFFAILVENNLAYLTFRIIILSSAKRAQSPTFKYQAVIAT